MNTNRKIILVAALSLAIIAGVGLGYTLLNAQGQGAQGNQSASGQLASDPNYFAGNVTTSGIPAGTYNGTGVYDHNCLPIGNGMYSCDAGIQTKDYGTIDFAYKHNMMIKPCIGPGDTLTVTIGNGGAATVSRVSRAPGYS